MSDFFISDICFNHFNIINYCNRPFKTVDEMNNTILDNINKSVKSDDRLFVVGNFVFGPLNDDKFIRTTEYFRKNIKCENVFLIYGNHDRRARKNGYFNSLFCFTGDYLEIKSEGDQSIVMCHYPIECCWWNRENSWHLHGHTHGQLKSSLGFPRLDVGVDNVWKYGNKESPTSDDYRPLSFSEVRKEIEYSLMSKK